MNTKLYENLEDVFKPMSDEDREMLGQPPLAIKVRSIVEEQGGFIDNNGMWSIVSSGTMENNMIDLDGVVMGEFPIKFGLIGGYFSCNDSQLTSLKDGPKTVFGSFYCRNNQLTSLEHSPEYIGGIFDCYNNRLQSLHFIPSRIDGVFICSYNKLSTLNGVKGALIGDHFSCRHNNLTTLEHLDEVGNIGGMIQCGGNPATVKELKKTLKRKELRDKVMH